MVKGIYYSGNKMTFSAIIIQGMKRLNIKKTAFQAIFILCFTVILSLGYNTLSKSGIPLVKKRIVKDPLNNRQTEVTNNHSITLAEAKQAFDTQGAIFLDARPHEEYLGGHIQGALSLPEEEFEAYFPAVQDFFSMETNIITYCSGSDCLSSVHLAEMLIDMGYKNVDVFFGGWQKWLEAGYPTSKGQL